MKMYEGEPISKCMYLGEYRNEFIRADEIGFLPSLQKFLRKPGEEGNFVSFHKFMANGRTFLIPKDMKDKDKAFYNEDLVIDAISGR